LSIIALAAQYDIDAILKEDFGIKRGMRAVEGDDRRAVQRVFQRAGDKL
jgi:hypothetical protein